MLKVPKKIFGPWGISLGTFNTVQYTQYVNALSSKN